MKPVPLKNTVRDLVINFVWILVIGAMTAFLAQSFVEAFDYDCTHPYQTPALPNSQENQ